MAEPMSERNRLAQQAMRRAARKVLAQAVRDNEPIPIVVDGKVVWKVPVEELAALEAVMQPSAKP